MVGIVTDFERSTWQEVHSILDEIKVRIRGIVNDLDPRDSYPWEDIEIDDELIQIRIQERTVNTYYFFGENITQSLMIKRNKAASERIFEISSNQSRGNKRELSFFYGTGIASSSATVIESFGSCVPLNLRVPPVIPNADALPIVPVFPVPVALNAKTPSKVQQFYSRNRWLENDSSSTDSSC